MEDNMECQASSLEEFKSAEALHRFEVSLMLGQTAVYLVATGTLLKAATEQSQGESEFVQILLSLFGIAISAAFLVVTHRSGLNQSGAVKRSRELAETLGYKLYSPGYRAPTHKYLAGKTVTKALCLMGGMLWLANLGEIFLN